MPTPKQVTGTFLNPAGQPCAGATVNFQLSQPEACSIGLLVHERVSVVLDQNGTLGDDTFLWGNDQMETAGSYYVVTLVDPTFGRILFERVVIAGVAPIDITQLVPLYVAQT